MRSATNYFCSLIAAALAGCTPVRLLESNDPRIEEGVAAYQESLETFVRRTLFSYEQCDASRLEAVRLAQMSCEGADEAVVAACEAEVAAERERVDEAVAATCDAASYASGQRSFYIPESARLSVLRSRAAVLDSAGACGAAAEGIATFVSPLIPSEIRDVVGADAEQPGSSCTEILVQTVIDNHEALAEGHRRIDEIAGEGSTDGLSVAEQAEGFFLIQRDTLVQNVRIVLLLEEAKKRGNSR